MAISLANNQKLIYGWVDRWRVGKTFLKIISFSYLVWKEIGNGKNLDSQKI